MRIKSFSGIILLLIVAAFAQSCGINKRIKKADKHFDLGEYYVAGDLYKKSYGKVKTSNKPLRAHVAFRQGESYRKTNHARTATAYQNAIRNNYQDSIVYFYLAQTLQKEGKYGDAAKNYTIYLEHDSSNVAAKNGLYASQKVDELKKNPTRHIVKKSKDFNVRRASTFSPAFVGNNADMLIFTSSRSNDKKAKLKKSSITGMANNKLYSVRKNASAKWEDPEVIEGELNQESSDNGVCTFSTDGRTMFFTRGRKGDTDRGAEILISNRAGGAWSEPQPLKVFEDSTLTVAHPTVSPDGTTIYFVSDAPDGYGGKDIWKAKLEGGECKYIENLGPDINTPGDEMFPIMRFDGTLFFSSNGHVGLGGLDIYKAIPLEMENKNDKVRWEVENMGVPINSSADDFSMTFSDLLNGFFSSNRDERMGHDMIWSFELPELEYIVEGKVMDDRQEIVADAMVRLVGNDGTNSRIQVKKDGTYRLKLNKDGEYVMMASARGYLNQNNKLSTHELTDSKSFKIDFQLPPIFKPVQVDNIFYEFAKWNLTPESETGLQALLKLLNDNPNITIEIAAHTDYVGDDASNKVLSEKRAQSVVDYLIRAGVARDRLTAVGYGEEKPFVIDAYAAKQYTFLKEGDVLTEEFIKGLKPEEQEQANQINRRTEFKVLKTTYNLF